ncbi:gliding motility-associated C-terminal domain-containing protein [Tenacibaculum mesophilum]|uniref:gliding motility-associated C-terminal domain-containing protein n=1 Tax=Tenacibaculum mesophilum TaxID=104268 RepID=UPI0006495610|nr:T9SS C-terminal target domain-containing protein [Tenacibaculum mesophilum]
MIGTTYNPTSDLPENTTIYVSVLPYKSGGLATGCGEVRFTTETVAIIPNCTTITVPTNKATNVSVSTGITWDTVSDADGYYLSIGTTSGGTDIVNNESVTGTNYTLTSDLPENTIVYVLVTPYNSLGSANGCSEISFRTEASLVGETKYGFSPNGDGVNDFWEIKGIEEHPNNIVTVFNRWGDMVFQMKEYDNQFNVFRGVANKLTGMGGDKLPAGTYFFSIKISTEGKSKETKGFLVLKR